MWRFGYGIAIILVITFFPARSSADILILAPAVDGQVLDLFGTGTFDSASTVGPTMAVNSASTPKFRAIMEFNISSIPLNATITNAVLTLSTTSIANAPLTIAFVGYTGNGSITPTDGNISGQTLLNRIYQQSDPVTHQINLGTNFLQSQLGLTGFFGLRIQDAGLNANMQFATNENIQPEFRPSLQLTFTAVPEPSSIALLTISLSMVMMACFYSRGLRLRKPIENT